MKNKCFIFFKLQVYENLGINKIRYSRDIKERKKLGLYLLVIAFIAVLVCGYSFAMAYGYAYIGLADLLPVIMMTVTSILVLATTFFKINGTLYGIKDYDMVMSLPVKKSTVIISRLLFLYFVDFLFVLGVMLPTGIVYTMFGKGNAMFYLLYTVSLFIIPIFPMILSGTIGAVITIIASRSKYKNAISIALSLFACIGIMLLSFQTRDMNKEKLTRLSTMLLEQLYRMYPPAKWYHNGISKGDINQFGLYVIVSLIAFALFVKLVSLVYSNIQTALTTYKASKNYKMTKQYEASPFMSLYKKELKRYFSCPIYVVNTIIGVIFLVALAISLLFFSPTQIEAGMEMPGLSLWFNKLIPLIESIMLTLCCTTASSLSLEGKNLWILKTSPVENKVIFDSKIAVNLTLSIPAILVSGIIIRIGIEMNLIETILLFVTPIVYAFFVAVLGMFMNIKLPNYEWVNEVSVVKQGASTMFTMLVGLISVAIPIFLVIALHSVNSSLIIMGLSVLIAVITVCLYRYTSNQKI